MAEENQTIRIEQIIHVAPGEVYRAFTNATALREWLCDIATVDPRLGGRFYIAWNNGDYDAGSFTKVDPDKEIEIQLRDKTDPAIFTLNILLSGSSDQTRMVFTQSSGSGQVLEQMQKDLQKSLKNLVSVLEEGPDLRITTRPLMGIQLDFFNEKIASELGVPVCNGVRAMGTVNGLGAQKAGLQKNDIIVELAGIPQVEFGDYLVALQDKVGGDVIKVVFFRGADKLTSEMELSKREIPEIPSTPAELGNRIQATQQAIDVDMDLLINGMSDDIASRRPGPKDWNTKEIIAHLLHYERYLQNRINDLVFSQEEVTDGFSDNLLPRVQATATVYENVQGVYLEFKRNQAEIVELVKHLPEEFAKRKSTWWRLSYNLLTYCDHTRDHLNQIKTASGS